MAFLTAMESRVIGQGIDLGDIAKSFSAEGEFETSDATVINDTGRKWTFGEMKGSYKAEGFLSQESIAALGDGAWETFRRALGTNGVVVACPVGDAVGYPAVGLRAGTTKGAVMVATSETEGYSLEGEAQSGIDLGVSLLPWGAQTAVFNGTAVDAGASSANGAVAHIAWGAFAGTTVTVKVQHCATQGGVYVDLGTFTAITAARGGERLEIPASFGTINRWTRIAITAGTFTNLELIGMISRK